MIVTSQSELRATVRQCQDLTCHQAALHQAAETRIDEIVGSAFKLDLARVRAEVLLEPERRDMYRFIDSNVSHIHSQSSLKEELMLVISERILEFGVNAGKDESTAQDMVRLPGVLE